MACAGVKSQRQGRPREGDGRRGTVEVAEEAAKGSGQGRTVSEHRCLLSRPEPGPLLRKLWTRSVPSECFCFVHCDGSKSREGREPRGPK